MSIALDDFKTHTLLVADTADIRAIKQYQPIDATTNPSLILKNSDTNKELITKVRESFNKKTKTSTTNNFTINDSLYCEVAVAMGVEILKIISGRVSTEVPSRYSYDIPTTLELARHIIALYEEEGVDRDRILIKISSTWEGIQAAKILENENIHCNMTLLFSLTQAISCAEAGVKLISPFVGRVSDWYKMKSQTNKTNQNNNSQDHGVTLVTEIYNYYRHFDYTTEIMGASFRNLNQILDLVGCDLLTISPKFIEELRHYKGKVTQQLSSVYAKQITLKKKNIDQKQFLWEMCENTMATEKLTEGIRLFHQDFLELTSLLKQ